MNKEVFHLRPCEIQRIDKKEYPLALEFYLQFDSMYTNSFDSIISMISSILISSQYVLYEDMFISLCSTSYT